MTIELKKVFKYLIKDHRKWKILNKIRRQMSYHILMNHWKAAGIMVARYKRVKKL